MTKLSQNLLLGIIKFLQSTSSVLIPVPVYMSVAFLMCVLMDGKIPKQCIKTVIVPIFKNKTGDISHAAVIVDLLLLQQLSSNYLNNAFYPAFPMFCHH